MSKSVGNVVDPFVLVKDYGVDPLRYFLLREVPFGQDGNYSRDGIVQRINADLANDLGNLAQRSLSMIAKNCEGRVPEPGDLTAGRPDDPRRGRRRACSASTEAIDDFAIHRALEIIWALVADANRYFAGEEPWAHKKTNPKRMETILYVTAEVTRQIAILVQPVMPESAGRLLDQLGVPRRCRDLRRAWAEGTAQARNRTAAAASRVSASCRGGGKSGGVTSIGDGAPRAIAAELLDARLVDAFDNDAADHGAGDGGVAKLPQHDGLDLRGRRIQDAVPDVIARKDGPDLFAIGAPRGVVQNNALAAAGLGRSRSKREQRSRHCRSNEMVNDGNGSQHLLSSQYCSVSLMLHIVRGATVVII